MCDQTEISYLDDEVVWVKLGNCWWPGEVIAPEKLSPDILRSYRKPPIAIVKFFQEDAYEFVKNINSIYKYQCSRKHEFINKGLSLYRTKHGHMEKFPQDVIRAETKIGGDLEILTRDEFRETKKESYAGLFGTPAKKTPGSLKKGKGRSTSESHKNSTPVWQMKSKTDYKVHILVQGSKSTAPPELPATPGEPGTPSTSNAECPPRESSISTEPSTSTEPSASTEPSTSSSTEPKSDYKPDVVEAPSISTIQTPTTPSTPSSGSGIYACHACSFTTTRLNVLILHNKSHSVSFMPYTPTPVKKKPVIKTPVKSTPSSSKPKQRKPRKEKTDKPVKTGNKKRLLEEKISDVESKKQKTDEEIKSSLLADWDDDVDDESNDESATATAAAQSPEIPLGAESPAVPTAAELPAAQVPTDLSPPDKKPNNSPYTEKPEASSDSNKYEFCEDEDWPVEADAGRKIPRVKNPVRTEETKSISIDEDDMAREVAELLNKTAVPELPSVPEPLKVEENFPEPSVAKSPDKILDNSPGTAPDVGVPEVPQTKAIFKTKTFFRSRHSRSQDAIGKYVAEQLNNVEKMDIADCELNGSDNASSPEARDSPPIEHVKVARLAPKIQLKKMKAEAQLREKERNRFEPSADPYSLLVDIMGQDEKSDSPFEEVKEKENTDRMLMTQNVLYPTPKIIPVSEIDPPTEEIENVTNYDASTEGEDTCETVIEDYHQATEESESSQGTYRIEIDHDDCEKAESSRRTYGFEIDHDDSNKVQSNQETYGIEIDHDESDKAESNQGTYGIQVDHDECEKAESSRGPYGIEIDHDENEKTESSQGTYGMEIDHDRSEKAESSPETYGIEANHDESEKAESSQGTYGIEIDPDESEKAESSHGTYGIEIDHVESETAEPSQKTYDIEMDHDESEKAEPSQRTYGIEIDHDESEKAEPSQRSYGTEINHDESEKTESSQETYGIEIDHDESEKAESSQESLEEVVHNSEILYQEKINKIEAPGIKVPEQMLSDTPEPTEPFVEDEIPEQPTKHFMNESTASAVDALLSVSREADRVTRTISDDPPEDLFEDDNKEGSINSNINEETNDTIETEENTERITAPENEQKVVMAAEIEKDPDQSMFSLNEEREELDKTASPKTEDVVAGYPSINTTNNLRLSKNEAIPITSEEYKISEFSSHVEEEFASPKVEEIVYENVNLNVILNEHPAGNEQLNKSVFLDSEEVLVLREESNKSEFDNHEEKQEENIQNVTRNEVHIPETHVETEPVMIHSGFSENEEEIISTQETEVVSKESGKYLQHEKQILVQDETEIPIDNNPDEYITNSEVFQNEEVVTTPHHIELSHVNEDIVESIVENVPSESDLQVAEALINLPATGLASNIPTENHNIMSIAFELDNVQEEIIQASEVDTVPSEKAIESTSKSEQHSFITNDDTANVRFETEQEKCENLNAAQSLLHMSASIEHTIGIPEPMDTSDMSEHILLNVRQNNGIGNKIEQNASKISTEIIKEPEKVKKSFLTTSSKLLKMLEEPSKPKFTTTKFTPSKHIVMRGKEKILNFDVAKASFKSKQNSPNQKIIIRRTTPSKTVLNNINEIPSQDKLILSRSNPSQDGSSVQRFTIQTTPDAPSDANTIIIQQKIRKLSKPATKIQKVKQHTSLGTTVSESNPVAATSSVDNALFDINSMPIVLSEDLITAESIEKMPVVMSDAAINPVITQTHQPPKPIKPKLNITANEKITVTSMPKKQEVKTLLMNSIGEVQNKSTTPNILSKSAKLRAAKPMLVIDKTTGKQKIIMTKAEPTIKEVKQIQNAQTLIQKTPTLLKKTSLAQKTPAVVQKTPTLVQKTTTLIHKTQTLMQTTPTLLQTTQTLLQAAPTLIQAQTAKQSSQAEKFIILPTQNTARTGRTQKIVIDPQTGKAHMILSRGKEVSTTAAENKPVSAKLVPSKSETNPPGNTVMIITNAQGAQSRIVLTPEHEKILFPNKQQQKGSQLKTIAHRITTSSAVPQLKTVLNPPSMRQIVASAKTPTRIVPKQKNAIITSKGQLIVGGRVATTAQNIAPMPEIRHAPKRLSQTEPRKLVQAIQKTNSEPIIYLQQKSGAVMQLTASQFEQLQRTGQIVQKTPAQPAQPSQERVIIQKSRTIVEAGSSQKLRARKTPMHSPTLAKKSKHQHEIAIAPAPVPPARLSPLLPALTPILNHGAPPPSGSPALAPAVTYASASSISTAASSSYTDFENFEEMLPSTAIARQPTLELTPLAPQLPAEPAEPTAALADGQLLAVPGEHFGGPVGSFYLCFKEQGNYTPIDNRPLVLENNQLVPMAEMCAQPPPPPQPERRDILSAALANSDVFHADASDAPDFRDLNANVSVHCRVSETSTTLHQPIMTPQEMPSSAGAEPPAPPASLEDGLAVIGVTSHSVPTSLELPITVTDPRIALRTSDPLGGAGYGTTLMPSPGAELCYVSAEESISMPLLTEEEDAGGMTGGKSMPILTDDLGERAVSCVESALLGSPPSLGIETDDGAEVAWTRRLLTPGSDASDLSVEISMQSSVQLSVGDLADHT